MDPIKAYALFLITFAVCGAFFGSVYYLADAYKATHQPCAQGQAVKK